MINFANNLRRIKLKAVSYKLNRGMSYVELIVVLVIFGILSAAVMYSYGEFQAKVDIKNLASDIALKIVEAQKSALSGNLSTHSPSDSTWKPAYGVYFSKVSQNNGANDKNFFYFTDRDNDSVFDDSSCSPSTLTTECLDKITIVKGANYIENIEDCNAEPCQDGAPTINSLAITFKRPDSRANFNLNGASITGKYVQITVVSPKYSTISAAIKIYPSGRIQVN